MKVPTELRSWRCVCAPGLISGLKFIALLENINYNGNGSCKTNKNQFKSKRAKKYNNKKSSHRVTLMAARHCCDHNNRYGLKRCPAKQKNSIQGINKNSVISFLCRIPKKTKQWKRRCILGLSVLQTLPFFKEGCIEKGANFARIKEISSVVRKNMLLKALICIYKIFMKLYLDQSWH